MNGQQTRLPGWTAEQVVGTAIGGALVAGALIYFVAASMSTGDYGDMQVKLLGAVVVAVIGLIPLAVSLYSRHRVMNWWRSQQR